MMMIMFDTDKTTEIRKELLGYRIHRITGRSAIGEYDFESLEIWELDNFSTTVYCGAHFLHD
jgi:hypothetical protein